MIDCFWAERKNFASSFGRASHKAKKGGGGGKGEREAIARKAIPPRLPRWQANGRADVIHSVGLSWT
jgi:hypothetical protein